MTAVPTAYWPLPSLLRSLARAGWGDLGDAEHRGLRVLLRGLSDVLDDRTAAGETTAPQLADATGYSERWVRHSLAALERAGLVEWHRGGVAAGRPTPSVVRVVKAKLVELIVRARPELVARVRRRATSTAKRLGELRTGYISGRGHRRRSAHAEVAAGPHPQGGGIGGHQAAPVASTGAGDYDWKAELQAARAAAVPPPRLRVTRAGVVASGR